MGKIRWIALLVTIAVLASGCGGAGRQAADEGPTQPAASGAQIPASPAEALAQLEALPTPAGADPQVFAELKAGLRAMLEKMPAERFAAKAPTGPGNVAMVTSGVNDQGTKGIQWNYQNQGDYNFDGLVSVQDLSQIGINFQKDSSSPDWKSQARFSDGNGDGRVSINDLTPIGANFLSQIASYQVENAPSPDGPFTPLDTVPYEDGMPLLTGIRMYHHDSPNPDDSYRVIPLDKDGNPGEPSLISTDFLISDNTRIIGGPGGPTYVSHAADEVVVDLPPGADSPIAIGDVVVGSEDGGYLMKAMDVSRTGDRLTIAAEPAILTDVFLQGGLSQSLDDLSQVPPEAYTLTLDGQTLCDTAELTGSIESGELSFLPQADVAVNYNEFGGVTYLRGLVKGGPLKFKATTVFSSTEWSGPFPPTPADIGFYEHKMTGFNFDFTAYQNDVPVTMALQYDVYIGVKGDGDLFGTYVASADTSYDAINMGGVFDSTGIAEHNENTPSFLDAGDPFEDAGGNSFSITTYARAEIHTRLYGNPVPGNTEDLALTLSPQFTYAGTRNGAGYDYTINSGLENSYLLVLHHIGLDDQPQSRFFPAVDLLNRSGFIADPIPPG